MSAPERKNVTENSSQNDEEWKLVPPDGGWGWLILGGTLLINMLIPGTIKSFGVLFIEFIEVFEATPVVASWIPALCYFLYCSTGPLTTYLSIKTSYRTVTIAGGVCAALGMILSCFATSIVYLYISFGVMVGLGAGLSFPPGIFLVTSYFVKYRGLANGLAISGSAFGSIILPPFLRFLLELYGYRGAILIMGGLTFNVIVGALFYQPVSLHMKKVKVNKAETADGTSVPEINYEEDKKIEIVTTGAENVSVVPPDHELDQPLLYNNRKLSVGHKRSQVNFELGETGRKVSSSSCFIGSSGQINRKISAIGSTGHMARNYSIASNMSSSSLRYVSTAFHGSTLVGLHPEFSSNISMKQPSGKSSWLSCCKPKSKKLEDKVESKSVLWMLLTDPLLIIILISNATNAISYVSFTILAPSYMVSLNFDKTRASYILSVISSTDLVGRIGGAALSDILKLDKKVYFIGGYLISGIALAVLPLASTYSNICILCAIFGLASGTYIGITAVIMVDLLGEELLASSYVILLFESGVLQLISPPICGLLYEILESYEMIICCFGIILIAGAAVWCFFPLIKPKRSY